MSSTSTLLERAPVALPVVEDAPQDVDLAKRCAAELGYAVLAKQREERVRSNKSANRAALLFSELGIQPFTDVSVEKYKKKQLKRASFKNFLDQMKIIFFWSILGSFRRAAQILERDIRDPMPTTALQFVLSFAAILGVTALTAVLMIPCFIYGIAGFTDMLWIAVGICFGPRTALSCVQPLSERMHTSILRMREQLGSPVWNFVRLSGYGGYVPERVLDTALTVHSKDSSAELFVDELVIKRVTWDPFLVVRIDGASYYIDVWNEPEFQKSIG